MKETELPQGEYPMVVKSGPQDNENNLSMEISEGEYAGVTINITYVKLTYLIMVQIVTNAIVKIVWGLTEILLWRLNNVLFLKNKELKYKDWLKQE